MTKAIVLRFDTEEQHRALKADAKAQGRSLNKHILFLADTHPDRKHRAKARK